MRDDSDKQLIEDRFNGDSKAFKKSIARGRSERIKWDDLVADAKTLPQLNLSAQHLIKLLLGFIPPKYSTVPHEAFLKLLINDMRNGVISNDELFQKAEEHIKLIRNEIIFDNAAISYEREYYKQYFEYLTELIEPAKQRLTRFLGYEPQLECSLIVEMHLRKEMVTNPDYYGEKLTAFDIQCVTTIKYREVLLSQGKSTADNSPLVAMDIIAQNEIRKKKLKSIT